jgi:hypothetical protein
MAAPMPPSREGDAGPGRLATVEYNRLMSEISECGFDLILSVDSISRLNGDSRRNDKIVYHVKLVTFAASQKGNLKIKSLNLTREMTP